jgi:hypothetical protein
VTVVAVACLPAMAVRAVTVGMPRPQMQSVVTAVMAEVLGSWRCAVTVVAGALVEWAVLVPREAPVESAVWVGVAVRQGFSVLLARLV